MHNDPVQLAIVIPAYKNTFLWETLASIAEQSDKGFNVYVGNDAGPPEICRIVDEFRTIMNITYKRFQHNLGGEDLVAQWERCIDLTGDEPYLWLFPDDDIAEKNLVKYFHAELRSDQQYDVYRFNTKYINDKGELIGINPVHPDWETSADYLESRLTGKRLSSIGEHIFSRKSYEKSGFRNLPLAWGTDDLAWIEFSAANGIKTIPASWDNSCFQIRLSVENISSINRNFELKKIRASLLFLSFVGDIPDIKVKNLMKNRDHPYTWFLGQIRMLKTSIVIHYLLMESKLMKGVFGHAWILSAFRIQFDVLSRNLYYQAYKVYKRISI